MDSITRLTCGSLALRWCEITWSFETGTTLKVRFRRFAGSLNASPSPASGSAIESVMLPTGRRMPSRDLRLRQDAVMHLRRPHVLALGLALAVVGSGCVGFEITKR